MPGLALNGVSILGSFSIACPADVSCTASAVALTAPTVGIGANGVEEIFLQADSGNTADILVGDSARQTIHIAAGFSLTIPLRDPSKLYVKSASGTQTLHILYRGQP